MTLALLFSDFSGNFKDQKHFKAYTLFGDINEALVCENISHYQQAQRQP